MYCRILQTVLNTVVVLTPILFCCTGGGFSSGSDNASSVENQLFNNGGNQTNTNVLSAPTNFRTSMPTQSTIQLDWSIVNGATGYKIYENYSQEGTYNYYASTSSTAFLVSGLSSGTTYYFKVLAYNSSSESNFASSQGTTTPAMTENGQICFYSTASHSGNLSVYVDNELKGKLTTCFSTTGVTVVFNSTGTLTVSLPIGLHYISAVGSSSGKWGGYKTITEGQKELLCFQE